MASRRHQSERSNIHVGAWSPHPSRDSGSNRGSKAIDEYIDEHALDTPDPDWDVAHWEPATETTRADLVEENISSVVWATGYHCDFSWIDGLSVDRRGYPSQTRGLTDLPGLYFVGLNKMHTIASSLFKGVGGDAAHLVDALAEYLW